uniref:Uncharacterized protein n=1 Tax=Anguilla anguilla TaxID=7936 RepID=A0A0E9U2Q0_ANGAN
MLGTLRNTYNVMAF